MKDNEENPLKAEAREKLTVYVSDHHLRNTPERYAVLDAVFSSDGLFDVDMLYQQLEEQFRVSRASIYSTLDLLVRIGLVARIQMPTKVYYERNIPGQVHLYKACTECGLLEPLVNEKIERLLQDTTIKSFNPMMYSLTISGLCSKCQATIKRRRTRLDKKKASKVKAETTAKEERGRGKGKRDEKNKS